MGRCIPNMQMEPCVCLLVPLGLIAKGRVLCIPLANSLPIFSNSPLKILYLKSWTSFGSCLRFCYILNFIVYGLTLVRRLLFRPLIMIQGAPVYLLVDVKKISI